MRVCQLSNRVCLVGRGRMDRRLVEFFFVFCFITPVEQAFVGKGMI